MNRLDAVPGLRLMLTLVLPMSALLAAAATVGKAPAVPAEIVYAVRASMGPHWYENFGYFSTEPDRPAYPVGGRLSVLSTQTGTSRDLINDPRGSVRDPQVHYDGKRIVFSYRPGGTPTYHLYEINVDGTGLRRLTDGPDDDIEPCYIPDGGIVFVSSRCHRFVNCWFTRVATIYRCDGDGRNTRMLSCSIEHDNTPWVMPDGRILYMRWEYVDRSQVDFHHLWTMNPDGTNQTVYYGNMRPSTAMLDAKPIPGTRDIVASFSPGHGLPEHAGAVTIVESRGGPDEQRAARRITASDWMRDPYPLSGGGFLAATGRRIVTVADSGSVTPIHTINDADPNLECHEPRPIEPRPREPIINPRVDPSKSAGAMVLSDVYHGRGMAGVKRGEIKRLLVFEQLPKPVNFSGGMEPLSLGGTFTLARALGTVAVESDGSAHFELPAMRPVFFVALDANGLSVKRMQSFTSVQPGERIGCVGCHEPRTQAPTQRPAPLALRRPADRIEPLQGLPDIPDFPRDVQPILDRLCVTCHNSDRADGGVNLSGDRTPMYTMAYEMITYRGLVADGRNLARGNRPPRSIGSSASRLLKLMDGSHHGAAATPADLAMVRLWIDAGATYPGTYASLGCGMAYVALPIGEMVQRCGSCHNKPQSPPKPFAETLRFRGFPVGAPSLLCNLSRPEASTLLRAPLSVASGGLGRCGAAGLASAADPLYGRMLAAIRTAGAWLANGGRFDAPGFRPNPHYIREMQRFGILPAKLPADAPVDPYATDRRYWDSFVYRPTVSAN